MTDNLLNLIETSLTKTPILEGTLVFFKDNDKWEVQVRSGERSSETITWIGGWISLVNPSTSEVNPSTSEVNPSTSEVNPSTSEVNPFLEKELREVDPRSLSPLLAQSIPYLITPVESYPARSHCHSFAFKKRTGVEQLFTLAKSYDR